MSVSAIHQALLMIGSGSSGGFTLPYTLSFTDTIATYEAEGFTFVLTQPGTDSISRINTYSGEFGSALYPRAPDTDSTPSSGDPPPTSGGYYLRYESFSGGVGTLTINLPAALIALNPTKVGFWSAPAATGGGDASLYAYDALGNNSQRGYWPGGSGSPNFFVDTAKAEIVGVGTVVKLVLTVDNNWMHLDDITFYA